MLETEQKLCNSIERDTPQNGERPFIPSQDCPIIGLCPTPQIQLSFHFFDMLRFSTLCAGFHSRQLRANVTMSNIPGCDDLALFVVGVLIPKMLACFRSELRPLQYIFFSPWKYQHPLSGLQAMSDLLLPCQTVNLRFQVTKALISRYRFISLR